MDVVYCPANLTNERYSLRFEFTPYRTPISISILWVNNYTFNTDISKWITMKISAQAMQYTAAYLMFLLCHTTHNLTHSSK